MKNSVVFIKLLLQDVFLGAISKFLEQVLVYILKILVDRLVKPIKQYPSPRRDLTG